MTPTENELNILQAAEKLFTEHGYNATSTTDIAREAKCTQALVHYYYRTKENLFQKVFLNKLKSLVELIKKPLEADCGFEQKIRLIIESYFDLISQNRALPLFIFNELVSHPERREMIKAIIHDAIIHEEVFASFDSSLHEAVRQGKIRDITAENLLIDIVSLNATTFIIAPIYANIKGNDDTAQDDFLTSRKEEIVQLITRGLKA